MLLLLACAPVPLPAPTVEADTDPGAPAEVWIAPYVQAVGPEDAWVLWMTAEDDESVVTFGVGGALDREASGTTDTTGGGAVHEVRLEGLTPDTVYTYVARTGATASAPATFRTAPARGIATTFKFVAASDMQRDDALPDQWADVVSAMAPWGEYAFALLPGDLTDNGWLLSDWTDDFFDGVAPLAASVPVYPVPGNHEGNTPYFFRFFHLPDGPGGEHWWSLDYANLRVIGLDSNTGYDGQDQLDWLDAELAEACVDDTIEFVFAQLHHPWRSELWVDGESPWTGDVVARLEAFSTACGKPSVHLYGHTHGYARGQSRDHAHLWVDVATGGGAIDTWGSTTQVDYDETQRSEATYGFVVFDVEPGAFTLRRVSLGTPEAPLSGEVTDEVTIHLDATPPDAPVPDDVGVVSGDVTLRAGAFVHPAGGLHGATHWQVSADCTAFADPVLDRWEQHEDWFGGVDLRDGKALTETVVDVSALSAGTWCWRARFRDRGLAWSPWSATAEFVVPPG